MTTEFNSIPSMHNKSRCAGAARFLAAAAGALLLILSQSLQTPSRRPPP